MARTIAAMKPAGVRLTLAHLDRNQDMSRDQALRWTELVRQWFDVPSDLEGAARRALGQGEE